ncbi:MAG: ATP-binding protein [Spirochaetia bacterium]|nr:ATP-binding protein [Spirochaetia bacterium]MBR4796385.1 ATP-binding protein [Spirochaetia bacterium]MBR5016905.1 ATP-binding protein [Spirochaetia bacterium]
MQLNFSIPGDDMDLAGIASSTLKKKLQQIGVDNSIIKRTVVALYEAEINMVIHGGGGDITINVTPTEIQCELTDHGPGIADVNLAMQEGYSTATDAIREMGFGAGMGLPNIQRNSDSLEIHTVPGEGTTVKIMIKIG